MVGDEFGGDIDVVVEDGGAHGRFLYGDNGPP
jgi:hypothetical protein